MRDVVIVGGSFAGLTAALQLGRTGRDVVVVDAGAPRNRMSPAAHGVPGWDGAAPGDILARFRADLAGYGTVRVIEGTVTEAAGAVDAFHLTSGSGDVVETRRILMAHGVRDALPDLPGVAECWGRTLLHCPYCHGHEVRDRPLAVLAVHPMAVHQAEMLRADWSAEVTLLTGAGVEIDLSHIDGNRIAVDTRPVAKMRPVADGIEAVFQDGGDTHFAAIFTQPQVSLSGTPAAQLGCAFADGPLGPFIRVGPMGQTSVPGVFAAGDCARPGHSVTLALGDGAGAGTGCHQSLLFPDMIQPVETS